MTAAPVTGDAALVAEYLDLCEHIDEAELRKAELAALILSRVRPGQRVEVVDGVGVQVVAGPRRFSPELAAQIFTPEQLAEISVPTISTNLAKSRYPVQAEAAKVAGKPQVRRL
jgi:hypothetical protein